MEDQSTAKGGNRDGARTKRFRLGLAFSVWPIALLLLAPNGSLAKAATALHWDDRLGPAFVGFFGLISQVVALWLFHGISRRPADRLSWWSFAAAAFSLLAGVVCFAVMVGSVMQGW